MSMQQTIQSAIVGCAVLVCGGLLPAAEIVDGAGYFKAATLEQANRKIAALEQKHRTEIHIETYASVPQADRAASETWTGADRLRYFETWILKRAKALDAKGIFILICKEPAHLHVSVEKALSARGFDSAQRADLQNGLLANFRQKQYDAGLTKAIAQLESDFANLSAPASATGSAVPHGARNQPGQQAKPTASPLKGILGIVLLFVGVIVVVAIIGMVIRAMTGGGSSYGGGMGGGYGGGGGGGFMSSLFGGIAGAMAGNWLYDSMSNRGGHSADNSGSGSADAGGYDDFGASGNGFEGGDSGGGDFGGGDYGGGGDFGGDGGDF